MTSAYRALVFAATALAFVVIVAGAYVRLNDAGLGCPDWPGCYGEISPAHAKERISQAVKAQGGEHGPVSTGKAWREMGHRYLAGALGILILVMAIAAWRARASRVDALLPSALVVLVALQAALGMWTVTLLLKPVIVTLHLLGGMATFALLAWLVARELDLGLWLARRAVSLRKWALAALAIVFVQIALGGWVSSNYAALACVDFPACHGQWLPAMDFRQGFQLVRELGKTASGTHLAYEALTAIHWTHRVGALVTFLYVGAFAVMLVRMPGARDFGVLIGALLLVQVSLGVANVLAGLPLAVAVAHNAVAALLLSSIVLINFALFRASPP